MCGYFRLASLGSLESTPVKDSSSQKRVEVTESKRGTVPLLSAIVVPYCRPWFPVVQMLRRLSTSRDLSPVTSPVTSQLRHNEGDTTAPAQMPV